MSASSLRIETTHFNVRFENNPKGFYHPNETIQALKLSVTGIAKCAWKKNKGKKYPIYQGKQIILDYETHFFGRQDGSHIEVSVGVHLYSFTCKIPANAVSSYDGTHGSVKYKITVVLDSPAMPDVVYEVPFHVLRIESLSACPWLRRGIEVENEHQVGMLCCETLPLLVTMRVECVGYALGDTVNVNVTLCNQGPAKFKNSMISLDRVEICNSETPEQCFIRTRKVVTFHQTRNVKEFESVSYDEMLLIPDDMPVSSERNCDVFQISYEIKFTSKSTKRSKIEAFLPITIAHIPFPPETADSSSSSVDCDLQSSPVVDLPPLTRNKSEKILNEIPAV
ncbi:hypothetical protein PVAND_009523 [Polypedilum vanderplanki]|uniref:Arrestin C-terminal-like domain-containing protein n=1 Tax=Polypedilum vanderplanki TaxID=319348 RepID=A0A9J6CDJ0_POLVA|nr:hypothetical protein PVAND_009523 [Polypedilum vanderplanki]